MKNEILITSVHNAHVKGVVVLQQKSAERRRRGAFVVEGRRELMHCMRCGYEVDEVFVCREILEAEDVKERSSKGEEAAVVSGMIGNGVRAFYVSAQVYDRMAYRGGTEGVLAVVRASNRGLEDLCCDSGGGSPLFVVLEGVEKPGNVGAILRTADAAGVDGVILADAAVDVYNPNIVRASMGAVFSVPVVSCESAECIGFLKRSGVRILTAQLQDSCLYYDSDMTVPTAIVMGAEDTGLSGQWREAADAHIRIPMLGVMDSLNVSVSAAVLMYEAVRQRGGKGSVCEGGVGM